MPTLRQRIQKLTQEFGAAEVASELGITPRSLQRLQAGTQLKTPAGRAEWQARLAGTQARLRERRSELQPTRKAAKEVAKKLSEKYNPKRIAEAVREATGRQRTYQKVVSDLALSKRSRAHAGILEDLQAAWDWLETQDPYEFEYRHDTFLVYKSDAALRATGRKYEIQNTEYLTREEPADILIDLGLHAYAELYESNGGAKVYHLVFFPEE